MISKNNYKKILALLLILNLWDAIATSLWVAGGLAIESNPLMAIVLDFNTGLFILVKTFLVSLCIGLLWRLKPNKLSTFLIIPVCILYAYIGCVHIFTFLMLLFGRIL